MDCPYLLLVLVLQKVTGSVESGVNSLTRILHDGWRHPISAASESARRAGSARPSMSSPSPERLQSSAMSALSLSLFFLWIFDSALFAQADSRNLSAHS